MVTSHTGHSRSNRAWSVLRVLLGLETLGLLAVLVFVIAGSIAEKGAVAQEISIIIMCVAALIWVGVTFVGVSRGRAGWARSSSVAIHVLTFATGTGCLQLGIGEWWLGFTIVVVAVGGFAAAIIARPEVAEVP